MNVIRCSIQSALIKSMLQVMMQLSVVVSLYSLPHEFGSTHDFTAIGPYYEVSRIVFHLHRMQRLKNVISRKAGKKDLKVLPNNRLVELNKLIFYRASVIEKKVFNYNHRAADTL